MRLCDGEAFIHYSYSTGQTLVKQHSFVHDVTVSLPDISVDFRDFSSQTL